MPRRGGEMGRLGNVLSLFLITLVKTYQALLRPLLPTVCKFHPSCSEYFIGAVRKYGPVKGAFLGIGRLARCNPWNKGGFDPP